MATYTVYRVNMDGQLSHKEHLDSWQEVLAWASGKSFGHIRVVRDQDRRTRDAMLTSELVDTENGPALMDVYDWIN
jgi:hypothetical protein